MDRFLAPLLSSDRVTCPNCSTTHKIEKLDPCNNCDAEEMVCTVCDHCVECGKEMSPIQECDCGSGVLIDIREDACCSQCETKIVECRKCGNPTPALLGLYCEDCI